MRSSKELGHLLGVLFDLGSAVGQTDGQLLARLAAGGSGAELAFQAVVERHGPMVLRVCRRVLRDPHEAHDAYQATFLVLARRAGSIRDPDALASWLHGVALRAAGTLRAATARRRRHESRAAEARQTWTGAPEPADPELEMVLHREIARLPARERLTVVLCDIEGRSYQEAASRLGCPVGTVKSRLNTARTRLRSRLIRRGIVPAGAVAAALADLAQAAPTPISWALRERTAQLAASFTTRSATAAPGVVPGPAVALAERTIHAMVLSKLKVLAMACGLFVTTAAVVWAQTGTGLQKPASDDRLQALENKLDRLIQVLERQTGSSGSARATGTSSDSTSAGELAYILKTSAVPAKVPDDLVAKASDPTNGYQTVTVYTTKPGESQNKTSVSAETVTVVADGKVKTIQADKPNTAATWKVVKDDRLDKIEHRLQMLSDRIDRIEKSVFGQSNPDQASTTKGDGEQRIVRYDLMTEDVKGGYPPVKVYTYKTDSADTIKTTIDETPKK